MTVISRRRTLGLLGATVLPMPFVRRANAEEPVAEFMAAITSGANLAFVQYR